MQPAPTQPEPSSPPNDTLPQRNRRRRASGRATRTDRELSGSSNAPSTALDLLTRSSPQQGSSREMTPPEGVGSIKYTRTGRVSRANKGKRVHHCEECGKTYTRAEHLRRHQQNHQPGAFPCDIEGCSRSFYREDLLARHKARHNDPLNPVTAFPSPSSQHSEPGAEIDERLQPPPLLQQQVSIGSSIDTVRISASPTSNEPHLRHTINTRTLKRGPETHTVQSRCPIRIAVQEYSDFEVAGDLSDSSVPYSPTDFTSPFANYFTGPPSYPSHSIRTRQSSDASHLGPYLPPYTSPSPASDGSSVMCQPYWGNTTRDAAFQYLGVFPGSSTPYHNSAVDMGGEMTGMHLLPEYRDLVEEGELFVRMDSPESISMDRKPEAVINTHEDRYIAAYWQRVHPFFPIIHRSTFEHEHSSPLLRSAMIALGAQALGGASEKTHSRIAHERCVKVLKKRTMQSSHSFRLCDLQAVILIEIYSVFKSRRPPLHLSKPFEDVYQLLASDPQALDTNSLPCDHLKHGATGTQIYHEQYVDDVSRISKVECKQRLLLACYMLDQQHMLLFGRLRSNRFAGDGVNLPFPRSQTTWEGDSGDGENREELVHWPVNNVAGLEHCAEHAHDVFQSMHLVGALFDSRRPLAVGFTFQPGDDMIGLPITESLPRVQLAYHTYMLCENTPIRDLLAVAGETWIISEKLRGQAEYTAAQIETRSWARGQTESGFGFGTDGLQTQVQRALTHALKILEIHQSNSKTGQLFQEWAVYLASLVVWARAYVTFSERTRRSSIPAESLFVNPALDKIISSVISRAPDRNIGIEEALSILLWAKKKIETVDVTHNCGLTNVALDILRKLVARGIEPGWF